MSIVSQTNAFSPSAFWQMDETSGTTANDSTAGANHLTISGDVILNQTATNATAGYQIGTTARGLVSGTGPAVSGNNFLLGTWVKFTAFPTVVATGTTPTATTVASEWTPLIATGTWKDTTNKTDYGIGVFVGKRTSETQLRVSACIWNTTTSSLLAQTLSGVNLNQWYYFSVFANSSTSRYGLQYTLPGGSSSDTYSPGAVNAQSQASYLIGASDPTATNASTRYITGLIDNAAVFPSTALTTTNLTTISNDWTPTAIPNNSGLPTISVASRVVGQTITSTNGTWTNSPTSYIYQWQNSTDNTNWTNISGATNSTYTIQSSDLGKYIRMTIIAENARGRSLTTNNTAASSIFLGAPVINKRTLIIGKKYNGQTLTATNATAGNGLEPITTTGKWQTSTDGTTWSDISGATSTSYTLQSADVGKYIRYESTLTNSQGTITSVARASLQTIRTGAASNYTELILDDSPFFYAKLDEAGTTFSDSSGHGHSTTATGQTRGQTSLLSNISDASTQFTTTGASFTSERAIISNQITIEAWIKTPTDTSTATNQRFIEAFNNTANYLGITTVSSTRRWFAYLQLASGQGSFSTTQTITPNTTYHVVMVYDGSTATATGKIYVDGTYLGQVTQTGGPSNITTSADTIILKAPSATTSTIMDEVAIYNRALTQAEITAHYTQGTTAPGAPPTNTAIPALSGTARVGQTLTTSDGTWTGDPTPTLSSYAWQQSTDNSSWTTISGETTNSLSLTSAYSGKYIRSAVAYTNSLGTATAYSTGVQITELPVVSAPTITGTTQVGQTLTASASATAGYPTPTVSYQWKRGGINISGATSSTYTLVSADAGSTITVEATATNSEGSDSKTSSPTATITEIPVLSTPTISGTPHVGETLTASATSTGYPVPTITYQWQRSNDGITNWNDLSGHTASTYTLTSAEEGKYVRVVVTSTNSEGSDTENSAATDQITNEPAVVSPTITGTAEVGETLTASATISGHPTPTVSYQWESYDGTTWSNISGATASTYLLTSNEAGEKIRVTITATNSKGTDSDTSAETDFVLWDPANTAIPTISYPFNLEVGETLTVSDGTWTGYPAPSSFTYEWEISDTGSGGWTTLSGETASTLLLTTSHTEKYIRAKVSTTTTAGSASAYSASTGYISEDPASVVAPTVSGTLEVGETLTADPGTWTGFPAPNFTYEWQSSEDGSTGWTLISGATSDTFVLTSAQSGIFVRVAVTGTNDVGDTTAASSAYGEIIEDPANTVAPDISGTEQVGETLTVSDGTWTGYPVPTITYQWEISTDNITYTAISGETTSTYIPQASDENKYLRVEVTATNDAGSASVYSDTTGQILPAAPVNTVAPYITGTVQYGEQLVAQDGTWDGADTFAYQWEYSANNTDWTTYTYQSASTLDLLDGDLFGYYFRCIVTASNAGGSTPATTASVGPLVQLPAVSTPEISGTEQVGETLTASAYTEAGYPIPTITYQWQDSEDGVVWNNISGATNETFVLTSAQAGMYVRVQATATNSEGSDTETSLSTVAITEAAEVSLPTISGEASVGETLTASASAITGYPVPTITYQWQRSNDNVNWTNISGATNDTYEVDIADAGKLLRVQATATNDLNSDTKSSAATSFVTVAPINIVAPALSGTTTAGQVLTVSNGTWTAYPSPSFTYQWQEDDGSGWSNIVGQTANTLTLTNAFVGSTIRCTVTATNSKGSASENSLASTEIYRVPSVIDNPEISGTVAVGETLTATEGTWHGYPEPIFAYQWQRNTGSWTNISGATELTYEITEDDIGSTLRFRVSALNAAGVGTANSAATIEVPEVNAPPNFTSNPVLEGTGQAEQALASTISPSAITGYPTPTITYEWQKATTEEGPWHAIAGADEPTFIPGVQYVGYYLRVKYTATNSEGTDTAYSNIIGPLTPPTSTKQAILPMTNARLLRIDGGPAIGVPADSEYAPEEAEVEHIRWVGNADAYVEIKITKNIKASVSGGTGTVDRYKEIVVTIPYLADVEEGSIIQVRYNNQVYNWRILETVEARYDYGLPEIIKCYVVKV